MNLKENDNLPNSEVFVLEEGEPVKKNIEDLIKNKKSCNIWSSRSLYLGLFCKAFTWLCESECKI